MANMKKFGKVMKEFKQGKLKSGSGDKVTNPNQAKAIAFAEANAAKRMRKGGVACGGMGKAKNNKVTKLT
tara:strand:+ start:132 stop:341 length:210 start_codon:yes stop_codon:yes gene_type:complete